MKSDGFNSAISDGTEQHQRQPAPFRPDYFNVDEMSFETLLSMASDYAASFNYYNSANQKDGSWAELFNGNEAVIMALIATCDVAQIESQFRQLKGAALHKQAGYVVGVAATLDFWLQRLTAMTGDSALELRNHIHGVIRSNLLPGLHTAAAVLFHAAQEREGSSADSVAALSAVWAVETDGAPLALAATISSGDAAALAPQIERALLRMTAAIRQLKTVVDGLLQRSLHGQSHEPAIGLFMVFLHLYEVAQQRLNRFTLRHLTFYYRDCLQSRPLGGRAEKRFFKFEPAAAASPFIIETDVEFSADKKQADTARRYHLTAPLLVQRATVSELRTIYLQRNRLVSPECELGHVTRIKAYQRQPPVTSGGGSMPLFGATKSGGQQPGVADATIGFCIASSMLALKEGRREVTLLLDFAVADNDTIEQLFSDAVTVTSPATFRHWFGAVFSHYLLSGDSFLNPSRRAQIEALIVRYDESGSYSALLQQSWQDLFYKLFNRPFSIALSGESGWLPLREYLVSPAIEDDSGMNSGLKIRFSLPHHVEAIVAYDTALHGEGRTCDLPMMNVSLDPEASFFSYSLLNSLTLKRVEIAVSVSGVKELVVANQLGRLDPAKPFAAFGPLPSRSAYMVVGCREAAIKPLTAMKLALVWGELPSLPGGFSSYYDGYDFVPHNSDFRADISVLQDGNWMPGKADAQYRVPLFSSGDDGVVSERSELAVGAVDYFKPLDGAEIADAFEYRAGTRNGFIRLQMAAPQNGFGHGDYPSLLTRVLTENSRRKKPLPLPSPPYTPTINQLSMSYSARRLIPLVSDSSTGSRPLSDRLFHLHPFGVEQVYPVATQGRVKLFPQYEADGNLFIGIEAAALAETLALFFELDDEATASPAVTSSPIQWHALTATGWVLLEANRVLSDSTEGFLVSGVVTLNLPQGMVTGNPVMPRGRYWLRVSCSDNLHRFGGLRSVVTNVAQLSATEDEMNSDTSAEEGEWRALRSVAGLAAVKQVGAPFGGRSVESESAFRTRMSERLRHKGRASAAWDYERLVLAQFPEIYKVKCFANTVYHETGPRPGNVLIVVVPHMSRGAHSSCEKGVVNSALLERIRKYLQQLSTTFVNVDVRNPLYERIQVRCSVKFAGDISAGGLYINRLNQAISDYISPWCDVGYRARFGWAIRADDIESYIRELDYVEFVTNFSMLHITAADEERYLLGDSAKLDSRHDALIEPRYPWSLAIPMREHFIETTATLEPVEAQPTGINELEVGTTFIIGGN